MYMNDNNGVLPWYQRRQRGCVQPELYPKYLVDVDAFSNRLLINAPASEADDGTPRQLRNQRNMYDAQRRNFR